MIRKGLIIRILMFTLVCSAQTTRPHEQKKHISGGIAKRSQLRALSKGRKILEKKIKEEKIKESERDKDPKEKYDNCINKSSSLENLLRLLNKNCFDGQPLTKKISELEQNKGLFSWFDRGRKPFGGLYKVIAGLSEGSYGHLMSKKLLLNDRVVDKALEVALKNLRPVDPKDYQEALALCIKKGYSKFGCKNVLKAYTIRREGRRRATEKQRYGKNVSVSRTGALIHPWSWVKSVLIDNLIIFGPPIVCLRLCCSLYDRLSLRS